MNVNILFITAYLTTSYSNYVGVYDGYSVTPTTSIVRRLLAYYTGETTPAENEKECTKRKSKDDEVGSKNWTERTQTPYTATYKGGISYGAKIGGIRVLSEQPA